MKETKPQPKKISEKRKFPSASEFINLYRKAANKMVPEEEVTLRFTTPQNLTLFSIPILYPYPKEGIYSMEIKNDRCHIIGVYLGVCQN